ncbi:PREDICTED: uncharacterized protein LOC105957985 isoform X2 [Erythranthe guttata]|uniref:uncharacterized protein LOC105957985 isoform X2 n=1 Tax=Erythranthe guttata TaxID=4155 RepID=UPI00064DC7EF|nr:PREDICTED: uncharacterized protein LOC105957985 isoform X2 [Erythranthe guttata]|eukprot:XP_012837433.1 PREDICTED: uncharacterized protein LOC105957985 isoform X2 [Erythranthe guttata]
MGFPLVENPEVVLLSRSLKLGNFRMTVEDSRKLLSPEFYPSLIVFSQHQKVFLLLKMEPKESSWRWDPNTILDIKTYFSVALPVQKHRRSYIHFQIVSLTVVMIEYF